LTQLFRKGRAESLDFGLGYQWRVLGSNLLLATRIEPQAINQLGAGSDSESIASKGPDVPPDPEQPATAPAAGAKKTTSKNGTKNQKSRTAAPRPAPVYFPFFFGR
jgi:hypothetical protein